MAWSSTRLYRQQPLNGVGWSLSAAESKTPKVIAIAFLPVDYIHNSNAITKFGANPFPGEFLSNWLKQAYNVSWLLSIYISNYNSRLLFPIFPPQIKLLGEHKSSSTADKNRWHCRYTTRINIFMYSISIGSRTSRAAAAAGALSFIIEIVFWFDPWRDDRTKLTSRTEVVWWRHLKYCFRADCKTIIIARSVVSTVRTCQLQCRVMTTA